jgi:hypothetical protein
MNSMIELSIIIIAGIAAAGFLIWFFYRSSAKQGGSNCAFCANGQGKNKNTCSSICRDIQDCETGQKNMCTPESTVQSLNDKRRGDDIDSA